MCEALLLAGVVCAKGVKGPLHGVSEELAPCLVVRPYEVEVPIPGLTSLVAQENRILTRGTPFGGWLLYKGSQNHNKGQGYVPLGCQASCPGLYMEAPLQKLDLVFAASVLACSCLGQKQDAENSTPGLGCPGTTLSARAFRALGLRV